MNTFLKKNGVSFGIALGILLIIPSLIGYFVDINFLVSTGVFVGLILAIIVSGIICISFAKKKLNGMISFKEAFSSYFVMLIVGLLISIVFNYVMFNLIDADFQKQLTEKRIENIEQRFEEIKNNPETTEENLALYQERTETTIENLNNENPYGLTSLFKGFTVFLAIFSIFGLLLSMILKSN